MSDLRARIGRVLRRRRLGAGLTQEALAGAAGLHRNYYGGLERGEQNVGVEAIARLTTALGVTLGGFFTDVDREA